MIDKAEDNPPHVSGMQVRHPGEILAPGEGPSLFPLSCVSFAGW